MICEDDFYQPAVGYVHSRMKVVSFACLLGACFSLPFAVLALCCESISNEFGPIGPYSVMRRLNDEELRVSSFCFFRA